MTKSGVFFSLGLAAVLCAVAGTAGAGTKRPVVVELFTSQGCDSCPPADALLGRLTERKDVLALSLPVTYWDMLGWKDTLASEINTRRQKAYALSMGHGGVYTPQMIVDGASDVVGSREAAVEAAIGTREGDMEAVPVLLHATPQEIHISVGAAPHDGPDATIWMFHVLGKATVSIGAGENNGHTITYRNIVRDVKAIGIWKGQAVSLDLPRQDATIAPHDSVAVVVQQGGYGRVIGVAAIGHPDYYPER
jgi:hypothetical protein